MPRNPSRHALPDQPMLLIEMAIIFALAPLAMPAAALAQRSDIPTPESVFGFEVGADHKLINYEESIAYFQKLAASSDRIELIEVGKTAYGRPWTVAIISSPENLAKLDHYREINMRLAHPSGLTDAEAHALAAEGRVFVDISGGLHASEIAGSQHTIQLAYDLLSQSDDPRVKKIFDEVIFFLWPSINPDGQDIVVDWCNAREAGKNPPPMELYEKYIGHDNNRDSYMLNVVESRVVQRTWREWEPEIIYVHHQSSPFPTRIWTPPFADPVGMYVPPIPAREVNVIGTQIGLSLDANGQPGATSMGDGFDAWYAGYIDYMPMYQNIASWWTETQGGNCATPRTTTLDDLPDDYSDLRPTPMYLSPWTEGTWRLRDAVDYMLTASKATLHWAADNRESVLYNRYQSGRDVIRKYSNSAPYAYIVPQDQYDRMAPVELLRRFAFMGIGIMQMGRDLTYDGVSYPKGTWVIPMDQEYAELARALLEVQHYPDLGDDRPYDAAGWTLPFQMNVKVIEGKAPLSPDFRAGLKPVTGAAVPWKSAPDAPFTTNAAAAGIVAPPVRIAGKGKVLELDPAQNNSFSLINRALAAGGSVHFSAGAEGQGSRYLVTGVAPSKLASWASELSVAAEATNSRKGSVTARSRIALYKASPGIIDQGWTQWLLDSYGFEYTIVTPEDIRDGKLASRFDVLVVASQRVDGTTGRGRRDTRDRSAADSAKAAATIRGVDEFVRAGGTIVVWSQGVDPAISALQLPVRDVVEGLEAKDYFAGISIMQVKVDPVHPVMAGMPERADVVVNRSPVLTTLAGFEGTVLASYDQDGSPLRSGWLNGAKYMQGGAAALDVKHGNGHVLLIAFQPQWRGQSTGTFRVVFNSLFFAGDIAKGAHGSPGFWSAPATAAGQPGTGSGL